MKIKRRLFISNLLMIVIPLLVSLVIFFGGFHLYAAVAGIGEEQKYRGEAAFLEFMEAREQVRALAEKWSSAPGEPNIAAMIDDAGQFNSQYSEARQTSLTIYEDGVPLSAPVPEGKFLIDQYMQQEEEPVILLSRSAVHAQQVGRYQIVLRSGDSLVVLPNYIDVLSKGAMVSLICSIFIVLLTNRFLTRFIFRKIVDAMDTLTYGVNQVRDGNLNFRIDYRGNDEFSEVCEDFNEMAVRLLESVNARQKDEQSRKELIAGISHDLRTPLTSIKAYVEGLEKGVADTPEAHKRYVERIKKRANDLENIIDTLFLFSKLDAGEFPYQMERVDLGALAADVVEGAAGEYARRGLDISVFPSSGNAAVSVDPTQIHYVMINIFENSIKYKGKERAKMDVTVSESGENVALILNDDGPGVPEETLSKLFDVFYRGDLSRNSPSKGSGLGLAIAAKMVRHFGGTVEARNVPGGGLSIVMTFPKIFENAKGELLDGSDV